MEGQRPCRAPRRWRRRASGRGARRERTADRRTEIRRPPGAADRQARRSRHRALGVRHRPLSRQCRIGRAGPVGSGDRGRGAGNARVHVSQPRDPELKDFAMHVSRDFSHYVRTAGEGVQHIDLAVEGVSCAGCMSKIERGLSAIPDVTLARVNLTDRRVALEWKEGTLDPSRFVDRLAQLGYRAYPFETVRAEAVEAENSRFLLRCLGVAAFATMNVMMLSVPVWSGSDMIAAQRDFFHWLSALIALPAAAYAGQPFFRSAFHALRTRNVNMDVPISIGVTLALGMSVVETLHHAEHVYFDAAIMLLTFLLVGRYLDQRMRLKTRSVAGNLAALKA